MSAFDEQALRDEYHAARRTVSQRARWDASDPGAPSNTCRYCEKHWRRWNGSKLDGHAACVVTEDFKEHIKDLLRSPMVSYAAISSVLGVSASVVRSWTFPIKGLKATGS